MADASLLVEISYSLTSPLRLSARRDDTVSETVRLDAAHVVRDEPSTLPGPGPGPYSSAPEGCASSSAGHGSWSRRSWTRSAHLTASCTVWNTMKKASPSVKLRYPQHSPAASCRHWLWSATLASITGPGSASHSFVLSMMSVMANVVSGLAGSGGPRSRRAALRCAEPRTRSTAPAMARGTSSAMRSHAHHSSSICGGGGGGS